MKIIISPAKKMDVNTDIFSYNNLPIFLPQTRQITEYIQSLSFDECQKLWGCNDKIAQQNFERFQDIDLEHTLTPAILSYEGIQYQYMAPVVFSDDALIYIENHLRILSGFYGILKPFDGVTPYRLEMQAKAKINGTKDLYAFWGQRLYQELTKDDHQIINLASKEYSKCIEKYLTPEDTFITCIFGEVQNNKIIQKGTLAKMARGEMVRFMAENQITNVENIKNFNMHGFLFDESKSSDTEYIFIKNKA